MAKLSQFQISFGNIYFSFFNSQNEGLLKKCPRFLRLRKNWLSFANKTLVFFFWFNLYMKENSTCNRKIKIYPCFHKKLGKFCTFIFFRTTKNHILIFCRPNCCTFVAKGTSFLPGFSSQESQFQVANFK